MAAPPACLPLLLLLLPLPGARAQPEPYPLLHDCNRTGRPPAPAAPDPLVRATWPAAVNASALQMYRAAPVAATGYPASSFQASRSRKEGRKEGRRREKRRRMKWKKKTTAEARKVVMEAGEKNGTIMNNHGLSSP